MGFIRRRTRRRTMLVAGGAAYAAGRRAQGEQEQEDFAAEAQPEAAAPSGEDGQLDELDRLAKLHESGELTDDEFAAEKAKILGT